MENNSDGKYFNYLIINLKKKRIGALDAARKICMIPKTWKFLETCKILPGFDKECGPTFSVYFVLHVFTLKMLGPNHLKRYRAKFI